MAKYIDGGESGEVTTSETFDHRDEAVRSLAGGHLARFVPIEIFCPLCPLWCCAPDLAAMAKYFDGDESDEMATSETSDRLDEAIRSLAGGYLARCFPIEISPAIGQLARLPLTAERCGLFFLHTTDMHTTVTYNTFHRYIQHCNIQY